MGIIDKQFKAHIEKDPWAYIKELEGKLHKAHLDQQSLTKQYEADRLVLIKEIESLRKQLSEIPVPWEVEKHRINYIDADYPLLNREYTPNEENLISIYQLCKLANVNCPLITTNPIMIELLDNKTCEEGATPKSFRNFPGQTYSTEIENPLEIFKMLAYSGFEWQAREVIRNYNNKYRSQEEIAMVNNLRALNQNQPQ
jgi:hypothetical protein